MAAADWDTCLVIIQGFILDQIAIFNKNIINKKWMNQYVKLVLIVVTPELGIDETNSISGCLISNQLTISLGPN